MTKFLGEFYLFSKRTYIMSQTNLTTDQNTIPLSKLLVQLFLLVLGVVGIYYVVRYAFPRLIPTEENYGDYYYIKV